MLVVAAHCKRRKNDGPDVAEDLPSLGAHSQCYKVLSQWKLYGFSQGLCKARQEHLHVGKSARRASSYVHKKTPSAVAEKLRSTGAQTTAPAANSYLLVALGSIACFALRLRRLRLHHPQELLGCSFGRHTRSSGALLGCRSPTRPLGPPLRGASPPCPAGSRPCPCPGIRC